MPVRAEAIAAVKRNAPGVPVSFRISVDHRFPGGRTAEETIPIVQELERAGVDLLLCDEGSYEAMDYVFPPYYLGDNCMVGAAEAVKPHVNIPVAACGNITPAGGEELLARGAADMIGVGRGLIADPDIVAKIRAGEESRIRPCIRCNQLCTGNAFNGKALGCAVNPEVSHEFEWRLTPTDAPDFKRELRKMIDWWEGELARLDNVAVHLGHEITADSPELAAADEIIVATGSTPLIPPIPGIDKPHVMEVIEAHAGGRPGHRVVVCGGGLSGADLALELAEDGHEVTLVEMVDEIARDMLFLNRISLLRSLAENRVRVLTGYTVREVTDDGVRAAGPDGDVVLECDTVVTAFGVRPATSLPSALTAAFGAKVHAVGDCVSPRKVGDAINDAYVLAYSI